MKKLIFISMLCVFLAAPVMADMAIDVDTNFAGRYGTTNGGEFLITVLGAPLGGDPIGNYGVGDQFVTFCVETNEYVNDGGDYIVNLNTAAVNGGVAGGNPDPLSAQSAYLYSLWLDGGITHNDTNANAIQQAIWWFEQENGGVYNTLAAQADTAVAVGGSWYNTWGANSIGNIRVMNLTTAAGGPVQDLLVRVPLPGAVLLGILGLSAAGLKLRKFA